MEQIKQINKPDEKNFKKLAQKLDELQKKENRGNGVSCIKSVVSYLEAGDLEKAKQVCNWDHDKIGNYPKLVEYIKENLFEKGEEHPWSVLERMRQRRT